jgi:hypothetical protein
MALKSSSFKMAKANPKTVDSKTAGLEHRHKDAINGVVRDARTLADDRRRTLSGILNAGLRASAAR